jgi:hypothetical protein
VIIESRLDRGRGPVATVLIQSGSLHEGDAVVVGAHSGRIRALVDPSGKKVKSAGPSDPVEILGISGVPAAGDVLVAVSDERKARQIAGMRQDRDKAKTKAATRITLEGLHKQIQTGEVKELRLVLKADVQGSVEALTESLERLSTDEVKLKVIHASVGAINESDVMLASASNAIVLGFNVKAEPKAAGQAQAAGVDVRNYNVIYEAINDLRAALAGMLAPEIRETIMGRPWCARCSTFKLGPVCGSYVEGAGRALGGSASAGHRGLGRDGHSLSASKDEVRERWARSAASGQRERVQAGDVPEFSPRRKSHAPLTARTARRYVGSAVALGTVEHLPAVDSLKGNADHQEPQGQAPGALRGRGGRGRPSRRLAAGDPGRGLCLARRAARQRGGQQGHGFHRGEPRRACSGHVAGDPVRAGERCRASA